MNVMLWLIDACSKVIFIQQNKTVHYCGDEVDEMKVCLCFAYTFLKQIFNFDLVLFVVFLLITLSILR